MGLYFFISGYFVLGSYERQGFGTFVTKKILRLGVPLLLMGVILTIATVKVEIAHMWFVESLLIFSIFYALVMKVCPVISKDCNSRPTLSGLFSVALVMGIGSYFIRQVSQQDHERARGQVIDSFISKHKSAYENTWIIFFFYKNLFSTKGLLCLM